MTRDDRVAMAGTAALLAALVALALALSVFRPFNNDEIEHVHSAWHVYGGARPYIDFYQHHHPLLWYALAPLLALTGQSASAMHAFRAVFFVLAMAVVWATYRLGLECRLPRPVALLGAVLLLSMTSFTQVAIEVRPDVPQTLFGVLSAIFLVRLGRTGAARDGARAGALAALAFLFLQKAIVVLAFFPVVLAWYVLTGQASWRAMCRAAAAFALAFAAVCLPLVAYLAATGSLEAGVIATWRLAANIPAGRSRWSFLSAAMLRSFLRNAAFWAIAAATSVSFVARRLKADVAVPAVLGLGTAAALVALNRVADRYLVAAMPFLAVAAAAWLSDALEARRARGPRALVVLLAVCLLPAISMVRSIGRSNRNQLARMQYVLDRSAPGERMFDPWRDYNLFRPDVHYFWFHGGGAIAREFSRMTGGRVAAYDTCGLLAAAEPPFVSDRRSDLPRCGLAGLYRPTPFDRFVERAGR
ncbi:MAG TPA: glycosyltransferase family 39 protein [Vicinamibacterales bacterium]|nr:glycosyltransferase family 39 protein [Vicinamibacterales bacterium]HPW21569.1 glycosyltransferase family 39 protein [Vicinamibacterales bacterium]